MAGEETPKTPDELLATAHLGDALESDRFRQFLDHIPFAVVVSELRPEEHIVYANIEFERLTGISAQDIESKGWDALHGRSSASQDHRKICDAVQSAEDYIGVFVIERCDGETHVDVWSNVIEDDGGLPCFRLVALAEIMTRDQTTDEPLEQSLKEKDLLLRELQHRVKNNLQMITALIRLEARNLPEEGVDERFERLAGRIEALGILYHTLSQENPGEVVDLGVYLSQVASAVIRANAVEGIRLDLKIDTWLVSVNVAMPTGLVVNELLTNSLKHAFVGRDGGTITLHSLIDDTGCRLKIADDGIGLAKGLQWPQPGKLAALMVRSLHENAKARFVIKSTPGEGVCVQIFFARADAEPASN
jgi:PAS domain S-box-containing protein